MQHKITMALLLTVGPLLLFAQDCTIQLTGYITDKGTGVPLSYANIWLDVADLGAISDDNGFFQFDELCPGDYSLQISHIGCEPEMRTIQIKRDTTVNILLYHHESILDEVVVTSVSADQTTEVRNSIDQRDIEENSNKNLADVLESLPGVSVLKNGAGASKPIIHGLSGNRVSILNNGIEQSGQQWGNDHAPEIDPFFANQLSVAKGASAVAYNSNALGSIVLVENNKITTDSTLHGGLNYIFQTNGLGNTLNGRLEKTGRWVSWRVSGSLKLIGDSHTPDYYLTNTGKREGNIALQLEKKLSDRWFSDFYFTSFNTTIGTLRGSHIGNLTDLEAALEREVPFFTADNFSYNITAPRQEVSHHLVKLQSKYFFTERKILKFQYGGQLNNRKEFDVRRNNRSDTPSLSLQQFTHFAEATYEERFFNNWFFKTGLQHKYVDNTNNPGTGILPLIPNYDAYSTSGFLLAQKERGKLFYEFGARYDLKQLKIVTVSQSLPREIERFNHLFHNYSFSSGLKYEIAEGLDLNFNAGHMLRAPEVNELYSSGLHQGVGGIEEGNRDLQSERSLKGVAGIDWKFKNLFIQAVAYHQQIDDYIYLEPQNEFRLTIRGAFPVFIYEQTDARIQGFDFLFSINPTPSTEWLFKYAHVDGRDLTNNLALINIPTDNLFSSFRYSLNDFKRLHQNSISINGKYVFQNKELSPEQDFVAAPEGYFLLGFDAGTEWPLAKSSLRFSLRVENALNTRYRDYLDRLRYFSDDRGVDVVFNVKWGF